MEVQHGSMKSEWLLLLFPFTSNRYSSYPFCMLVPKTPAQRPVAASVHMEVLWKGQPGCSHALYNESVQRRIMAELWNTHSRWSLLSAHHPLFPSPSIFVLCYITHRLGSWIQVLLKDLEPSLFFSNAMQLHAEHGMVKQFFTEMFFNIVK